MHKGLTTALTAAIVCLGAGAAPAAAQSYFSCQAQTGSFWGLYKVQGQSIDLWRPGRGWSGNLCAGDRLCSVNPDTIEMEWETRQDRANHYVLQTYVLTVNRRSGTASRRSLREQLTFDGRPYRINFGGHSRDVTLTGRCSPAEDPEAGPALF